MNEAKLKKNLNKIWTLEGLKKLSPLVKVFIVVWAS